MDFESNLSSINIGGKKSKKQKSKIENITNFYDTREKVIKFYKDYPTMMHIARYGATHGREHKIHPKQML